MGVIKTDDLHPDGIRIVVDWPSMVVGSSIFLPCIDTYKAKAQITQVVAGFGWECMLKVVIYNGKLGVRVWRTL
tara:strand:- start:1555 stop:1776 length:222 start_codon:yes stop_codon:yes gene_type:complete